MNDFIAIGDIVMDEFIRLEEASRATTEGEPDKDFKICLPFAEKIPYEEVYVLPGVGNAPNAAVSAARLGLSSAIITNIGDDAHGQECMDSLVKDKVSTNFVKINQGMKTNYHYALWFGAERTILIKHETYPYTLPDMGIPKWVYFSSVNVTAYPFHNLVADFLDTHPDTQFAFQPGKWEIKLGKEKLERLYKRSNIFFCNVEEASAILNIDTLGIPELLKRMHALGPKIIVITDGPKGAYAYDGVGMWSMPPYPDPKPPFERTGAGDAFASTTCVALALGQDLPSALAWGAINSMSVVQYVGAQKGLLSIDQIKKHLSEAPSEFKASKLN